MRLAREIRKKPGIAEVAALMGTPANRDILLQAGLAEKNEVDAGPNDLVLAVEADSRELALEAIEEAKALLTQETGRRWRRERFFALELGGSARRSA